MPLSRDLREFVECLNSNKVEYLVVGALAVSWHGFPRYSAGPAAVAQTLYRATEASRELRIRTAEERRAMKLSEPARESKPSKRDRRRIDRLRGRI